MLSRSETPRVDHGIIGQFFIFHDFIVFRYKNLLKLMDFDVLGLREHVWRLGQVMGKRIGHDMTSRDGLELELRLFLCPLIFDVMMI